jgi:hypothetical protein
MKKTLLLLLGALFFSANLLSQTPVSGGIYSNTTWTLANSPYIVTGNIVVFPSVVLTIQPGVEVRVKASPFNASPYKIEARGTINMIGTSTSKIKFKSDSASNSQGIWSGFLVKSFQGGSINFDYVSISNSIIAFSYDQSPSIPFILNSCDFNYNYIILSAENGLTAADCNFKGNGNAFTGNGSLNFTDCEFDSNTTCLTNYSSNVNVNRCVFKKNAVALDLSIAGFSTFNIKKSKFENNGIGILGPYWGTVDSCIFKFNTNGISNGYDLTIKNSIFDSNQVAMVVGYSAIVNNCQINYNQIGVAIDYVSPFQPLPNIFDNKICSSSNYNIENRSDLNLFIPTNCFCESDSTIRPLS